MALANKRKKYGDYMRRRPAPSRKRQMREEEPLLVCADRCGRIVESPAYQMSGMSGDKVVPISKEDLIPLPPGSDLFVMPGRAPVGFSRRSKGQQQPQMPEQVSHIDGVGEVQAVAAFLAPAYTRLSNAAFKLNDPAAPLLPLYAYTAVGWYQGQFCVPATRVDPDCRQDLSRFDLERLPNLVSNRLSKNPDNTLLHHLARCALEYGCPAARNLFFERWEAPLPTSPGCNAGCIGCISEQPDNRVSTFERIKRPPSVEDVMGVAVPHLLKAPKPVVSFGQGCEGEPLLQAPLLEASIKAIRQRTSRGIINLNTNASIPQAVENLCRAGLDSMRVSINSLRPSLYDQYYKPRGYNLDSVLKSIDIAIDHGVWVSINLLIFPGVIDSPAETEALLRFLNSHRINMIQWRNLNIDPDQYLEAARLSGAKLGDGMGIGALMERVRQEFPAIRFGYFNPSREQMGNPERAGH